MFTLGYSCNPVRRSCICESRKSNVEEQNISENPVWICVLQSRHLQLIIEILSDLSATDQSVQLIIGNLSDLCDTDQPVQLIIETLSDLCATDQSV